MSSGGSIDPVAVTALVISLVALLATCGQVLQQYFATADGYRRCQPSVMGLWGQRTQLRWRWREFRFETIYYVPSLSVDLLRQQYVERDASLPPSQLGISTAWHAEWVYNREGPIHSNSKMPDCNRTYVVSGYVKKDHWWQSQSQRGKKEQEAITEGGEVVCWVPLIDRIRQFQEQLNAIYSFPSILELHEAGNKPIYHMYDAPTVPCIRILKRSWDFMPPDVARPLCLSTVSDIASLASVKSLSYTRLHFNENHSVRLGLEWKEFDPAAGIMRAEGQGHLITSRIVRSIGVVLEYMIVDTVAHHGRRITDLLRKSYLPVMGVDDMIFGVVPGNVLLDCFDQNVGSIREINQILEVMEDTDSTDAHLEELLASAMKERPGWIPGFNDLIPLTAPLMSSRISRLNNVPMPNTYHPGLLRTSEGLQVFSDELRAYVSKSEKRASEQAREVLSWIEALEQYEQWKSKDSLWALNSPYIPPSTPLAPEHATTRTYHSLVLHHLDLADLWLQPFNAYPANNYNHLVREHVRMAISSYPMAMDAIRDGYVHPGVASERRNWLAVSMRQYWIALPGLADRVAARTGVEAERVRDAWITMVFRAFCWQHGHRLVPTKCVLPADWHGSNMPVYIG